MVYVCLKNLTRNHFSNDSASDLTFAFGYSSLLVVRGLIDFEEKNFALKSRNFRRALLGYRIEQTLDKNEINTKQRDKFTIFQHKSPGLSFNHSFALSA